MAFEINHLGKVKTTFMIDPHVLKQAKMEAIRKSLTVSNIVEEALEEYLQRVQLQQQQKV